MNELDRPGRFKATPTVVGLLPGKDSQSVAAVFDFSIVEMWDEDARTWVVWGQYEQTIRGFPNIIKTDGTLNQKGVESLMKAMRWSGNVEDLVEGSGWKPQPCQITVEKQTYNGVESLKVNWINEWNSEGGGGLKVADAGNVKSLAAKHGAKLRAIAGNLTRNSPPSPAKTPPPIPPEHVFNENDPELKG